MQETWVQLLGWEDPLEKEMATHCGVFAWEVPRRSLVGPWGYKGLYRTEKLSRHAMLLLVCQIVMGTLNCTTETSLYNKCLSARAF